jgi:hypothetical protein
MFNLNECNSRYSAHTDRVARIDRDGWQETATKVSRPSIGWLGGLIAKADELLGPFRSAGRVVTDHGSASRLNRRSWSSTGPSFRPTGESKDPSGLR